MVTTAVLRIPDLRDTKPQPDKKQGDTELLTDLSHENRLLPFHEKPVHSVFPRKSELGFVTKAPHTKEGRAEAKISALRGVAFEPLY